MMQSYTVWYPSSAITKQQVFEILLFLSELLRDSTLHVFSPCSLPSSFFARVRKEAQQLRQKKESQLKEVKGVKKKLKKTAKPKPIICCRAVVSHWWNSYAAPSKINKISTL